MFIRCLYRVTGVSIGQGGVGVNKMLKFLCLSFLCDGRGGLDQNRPNKPDQIRLCGLCIAAVSGSRIDISVLFYLHLAEMKQRYMYRNVLKYWDT